MEEVLATSVSSTRNCLASPRSLCWEAQTGETVPSRALSPAPPHTGKTRDLRPVPLTRIPRTFPVCKLEQETPSKPSLCQMQGTLADRNKDFLLIHSLQSAVPRTFQAPLRSPVRVEVPHKRNCLCGVGGGEYSQRLAQLPVC